jgi:hypothetical protein
MMHELDKYWTLTQFAKASKVSIPRVKRVMERLGIKTHRTAGCWFALKKHADAVKRELRVKVKRGPKKRAESK